MRTGFAAVLVVVAALIGVGAVLQRDQPDLPTEIGAPEVDVSPAVSPTPTPTATPTEEPDATPTVSPTADPGDTGEVTPTLVVAGSLTDILAERPDLSRLVELLGRTDLGSVLTGPGPVTLLAPTDAAFAALPAEITTALEESTSASDAVARQLLGYHLLDGLVTAADLDAGTAIASIDGVSVDPAGVSVVEADLDGGNGLVHIVDAVIVPAGLLVQTELSRLVTQDPIQFAAGSAELAEASFTVLDTVAAILTEDSDLSIEIQGHTDTDGADATNLALSQARADAVLAYLVAAGIDETRLSAVGYGETELIVDPESTPEDKARNRRIAFVAM